MDDEIRLGFARFLCPACGTEIPGWFDTRQHLYDVEGDDLAYVKWLETPCTQCGETPGENGVR